MHAEPHPLRGKTMHLMVGPDLYDFEVEDWLDRVSVRADAERESQVYGKIRRHGEKDDTIGLGHMVYDADLAIPEDAE